MHPLLKEFEKTQQKSELPAFNIGDSVNVHNKIFEGEKERVQIFKGVVIKRRGSGVNAYFTVRKIVQGEGVERMFPLNSPKIVKIEVTRRGKVRRAKLYYLRDRIGKATKVQEKLTKKNSLERALLEDATPAPAEEQKTPQNTATQS